MTIKASRQGEGIIRNPDEILQADKRTLVSVQNKMKNLFDILDDSPKGFLERYDLETLFDELGICIREADTQLTDWHLQ